MAKTKTEMGQRAWTPARPPIGVNDIPTNLPATETSLRSGLVLSEATVVLLIDEIFGALGYGALERRLLAESLLDASRAGYPPHGVMRIPVYVEDTRAGTLIPGAHPTITHQTPSAVAIDGRHCLGQVACVFAIEQAAAQARQTGIGCAAVRNSNDPACLGSYVHKPANAGLITMLMVNMAGGAACVVPVGSHVPFFSTNPIAMGVPRQTGKPPIVIDFSTSVVSLGRVRLAANQGEVVPEGWLVDRSGNPVTDPAKLFSTPRQAALLPTGGHKGFLMGLMVEVLAGALTGAGMSTGSEPRRSLRGLFAMVIDPEAVGGNPALLEEIERFVSDLEALPGAEEGRGVRIPGARRHRASADGIPVDRATWARIMKIAKELSLDEICLLEEPGD